ncbi:MAG TPA: hypothetical protein VFH03_04780 [Actinoplanes sp.]|nr:hypothetical protein [Actinoplanes sp.]
MPHLTGRPRPRLHFTPRRGWLNDPHGVLWTDGRYHLFFQYNPAGTSWRAAVSWGHATSADLVSWQAEPHPNLARYAGDDGPHPEDSDPAVRTLIVDAGLVEMTLAGRSGITTAQRPV